MLLSSLDTGGPNVTWSLVLDATHSPFSADVSLAGVTPGVHIVSAYVTSASGNRTTINDRVTVTSSPALVYPPLLTLGSNGRILAVDPNTVAYLKTDGTLHSFFSGVDTLLDVTGFSSGSCCGGWQTAQGYVFGGAAGADRPGGWTSIYMWAPDGTRSNLSLNAQSTASDQLVAVQYPWVLWVGGQSFPIPPDHYTFYNFTNGQTINIPVPGGVIAQGSFYQPAGELALYYPAASNNGTDVFRWDQSTGLSAPVTNDGMSSAPQTDGVRVAWLTNLNSGNYALNALSIGSGAPQTLSNLIVPGTSNPFELVDGLLVWTEETFTITQILSKTIQASDGTTVTAVSKLLAASLYGTSGGYVFFQTGTLNAWNAARRATSLVRGPARHHV